MSIKTITFFIFSIFLFACNDGKATSNGNALNPNLANAGENMNSSKTNTTADNTAPAAKKETPVYTYEIVKTYKHDPEAFTQGLVFREGFLYESTGEYGESSLRKVELASGKVLKSYKLANEVFAEGMTIFNDKIYQISWREKTCFVYDMDFKLLKEFKYQGEGWGITHDGKNLIMSDGTHVIRYFNPETFQIEKTLTVLQDNGKPLMQLNELEYINGEIWANIWHSENPGTLGKPNHIARIDPNSGRVAAWIDLANISPGDQEDDESENTLNGIAYDEKGGRIFVTGKNWKNLYEIKLKSK